MKWLAVLLLVGPSTGLGPDDPNLPGWVHGRVDALSVAIYEAAKQHAVP